MGLIDKLAAGIERVAEEADKALDKGKTKVSELQIQMEMDSLAKKLGYLVFDFYRGRQVDQALRQKILDDMTRLEDELLAKRAEARAKAEAEAVWKAQRAAGEGQTPPSSAPSAEEVPGGGAAAPEAPADQGPGAPA